MNAEAIFRWACMGWILLAIPTFFYLLKTPAPYGRYASANWGKQISNKDGWLYMELPVLLIVLIYFIHEFSAMTFHARVVLGLFVMHYSYRCLIYPFRIRTGGKQMPLIILLSAVFFNLVNGNLIGLGFTHFNKPTDGLEPLQVFGLILFGAGMLTHILADNYLLNLRRTSGNTGYQIPRGRLFSTISCPNYLGEIVEWIGFALFAQHIAAWSFAILTAANLVPRALHHHRWYIQHFPDYPAKRKALIPFVF
jgi:3-oxo-5-alpha-steroid 4-dehydrogenase 1